MMDVSLSSEQPLSSTQDSVVLFDFEGANHVQKYFEKTKFAEFAQAAVSSGDFSGKDGQITILYSGQKPRRVLLVGLGAKDKFHLNKLRIATAQAVNYSRQLGVLELSFPVFGKYLGIAETDIVIAIAESSILAFHKFDKNKTEKPVIRLSKVVIAAGRKDAALEAALEYATIVASNATIARELVNTPASVCTPKYVADKAQELFSKDKSVKLTVYDKAALQKIGANGLLAVAAGSINEPRLVVLEYSPKSAKKSFALVGKGITFDSGGLDIKPASSMETMKCDMSGSAAVLCTVLSASQLKLPVKVVGILAMTENMVGPMSYKPGDIVKSMSGKTMEILNTDAEGRVVLSDALHFSKQFKPDYVVDIATLTGACFVALGSEASGLVGNDAELISMLKSAGDKTFERVWELPFYPEYADYIKSDFADMKNVTSNQPGSGAGALTAARVLANFIEGHKWAHLDIAGTAWSDFESGYKPKGATGVGVRLLTQLLVQNSK